MANIYFLFGGRRMSESRVEIETSFSLRLALCDHLFWDF